MATDVPVDRAGAAIRACFQTWELPDLHPDQYEAIAAAVILSLRDPSDEMIVAGALRASERSRFELATLLSFMKDAWPVMIDAALGDRRG